MPDPEIKKVAGKEIWHEMTEEERIRACFKFNDDFQKMQALLPGGAPGIPFGVYRFKTQEEADAQVNYYIMKVAAKR
jgi:hypothetical protein